MKTDPFENTTEGKPAFKQTHNLPESGGDTLFVGSRAAERNAREGQKHTAGPYRVGDARVMCDRERNDPRDMHWPVYWDDCGCAAHVFKLEDAELLAEAGTVAHETGLTPRELLAQRDALLATMDLIADLYPDASKVARAARAAIDATKAKGAE